MAYGLQPVLGGVTLRRPSTIDESPERVGQTLTLANGASRASSPGVRFAWQLTWAKLTEAEWLAIRSACAQPVTTYRHTDGVTYTVLVDFPTAKPIPGTDPPRFEVSLSLSTQGVVAQ